MNVYFDFSAGRDATGPFFAEFACSLRARMGFPREPFKCVKAPFSVFSQQLFALTLGCFAVDFKFLSNPEFGLSLSLR